jgi:serine/threonine protein kinase
MAATNDDGIPVRTSDTAHAMWKQLYGKPRIALERDDQEPFKTGRRLGRGGWGDVYESDLNGAAVALKRVYFRNTPRERRRHENEFIIMEKLSGKRHRHIVELIGCYERLSRGVCELGLLIWPVAHCDLSRYLECMDIWHYCKMCRDSDKASFWTGRLQPDDEEMLEDLAKLVQIHWKAPLHSWESEAMTMLDIEYMSTEYLHNIFGCLAQAVAHLHNDQMIRHKDLKPSQILLALDGLWLTDFGWSLDTSELSNSATNNGANISAKYHAPERASRGEQYCGKPEDVFALGCTYLEMMYRLCGVCFDTNVNGNGEKGWSYQANLDQIDGWLRPLQVPGFSNASMQHLAQLIKRMMAQDAVSRPAISEVVNELAIRFPCDRPFFGKCCFAEGVR